MTKTLRVSSGIDGLPTSTIPDDPTQFVSWFKSVGIKRWLANADVRNATPGGSVQIGGTVNTPGSVSVQGVVTSVAAGTGLIATPSPIVAGGSIAIANIAGVAGTYTGANISVNGQGQITAAANGAGGNPFNITPDTHQTLPSGVGVGPNDEFESGSSIDLSGTRYTGATPWAWINQGTATANISAGSVNLVSGNVASAINSITQAAPAAPWTYQAKFQTSLPTTLNAILAGFAVFDTVHNVQALFGILAQTSATFTWAKATNNSLTATTAGNAWSFGYDNVGIATVPDAWFQLSLSAGGTFTLGLSRSGLPGTFTQQFSVTLAATGLTNVNSIGLSVTGVTVGTALTADWFRRTA